MAKPRRRTRKDSGAGGLGMVALLLPAVMAAGVGGFVLQRAVSDDGAAAVELPDNRYAAPVLACPGDPAVSELHNGDRIFAIGVHDELDGWLLIRNPVDPSEHWYIESRWVTADTATDELPEVGCDDPVPVDDGDGSEVAVGPDDSTTTTDPNESTTTTDPEDSDESTTTTTGPTNTTPGPTTPTTQKPNTPTTQTTQTTAAPDTTQPTVGNLDRQHALIREPNNTGEFCDLGLPTSTIVSATVTDAGGLQSVTLRWSYGGHSWSTPMTLSNGVWRATLGPAPANIVTSGSSVNSNWSVRATDNAGNTRTVASNPNSAVYVQGC